MSNFIWKLTCVIYWGTLHFCVRISQGLEGRIFQLLNFISEKRYPPRCTCGHSLTRGAMYGSLHGRGDIVGWSGDVEVIVELYTLLNFKNVGVRSEGALEEILLGGYYGVIMSVEAKAI